MLITPLITALLEHTMNHLLYSPERQNIAIQDARYRLKNQSIRLDLEEFSSPIVLIFNHHHVDVMSEYAGDVDCQVNAQLSVLKKLYDKTNITTLIRDGELTVEGDSHVLQQLSALLNLLEWDLGEYLSPYVGDVAAHAIHQGLKQGINCGQNWLEKQRKNLSQALVEEWQHTPSAIEVAYFCDQVDELEQQVIKLTVKIEALKLK